MTPLSGDLKSRQTSVRFTLIELLVVITIIMILSSMLIPALHTARAKARYARWAAHSAGTRSTDMLEVYYDFNEDNNYSTNVTNKAAGAGIEVFDVRRGDGVTGGGMTVRKDQGRWIGKAGAHFNGSSSFVRADNFEWAKRYKSDNRPATVMFWTRTLTSEKKNSVSFRVYGVNGRFQSHAPWGNNRIYWDYGSCCGGNTDRVDENFANYIDDWAHVTLVSDGSGGKFRAIYVNGKLIKKKTHTGSTTTANGKTLELGREGSSSNYYKGNIDEFAIWRRVMPPDEISAHYQNGAP